MGMRNQLGLRLVNTNLFLDECLAMMRQLRMLKEIAVISAYSLLSACIGSRREARHAGTMQANAATANSTAATAAKTAGSSGLIS